MKLKVQSGSRGGLQILNRRTLLKGGAAVGAVSVFAPAYIKNARSSSGEINVMFWSDELPEDFLKAFTEKTGIKVNFTGIGSNEEILNKMKATKGEGFDLDHADAQSGPAVGGSRRTPALGHEEGADRQASTRQWSRPASIWNFGRQGHPLAAAYLGHRGHLLAHRQMAAQLASSPAMATSGATPMPARPWGAPIP